MVNPEAGNGRQDGNSGQENGSRTQANVGGRLPGGAVSLPVREILRGSENYSSWSFATKMVLIKERTWCAVKERLEEDPEVSDEVSEQALATICLSIDPKIYGLVRNAKTAKEAWDNLRNTYEHSGSTRKIGLLRRLTGIRLVGAERDEEIICQTTQEYVNELFTTSHQLSEVGFQVDDAWLASLLMKGLPKQYEPMILGLESSGMKLTADIVKAKILQDVKVGKDCKSSDGAFFSNPRQEQKSTDKSAVKCFRCKKSGHYASQCQKKPSETKEKRESRGKQSGHAAFFAAFNAVQSAKDEVDWIFDSGATTHLCRNRDLLQESENVSASINVANSSEAAVVAKGAVILEADIEGTSCEVTMNNVLCVPDLAMNLLSVSKVCQSGYLVTFDKESCKVISPTKEVVAIGQQSDGLYKLKLVKNPSVHVAQERNSFQLWHRRLGHLSAGGMKLLKAISTGMKFENENSQQCVPCIQGKHQRQPFKAKGHRADQLLELVHSDLCGPMETTSLGGSRYFLTFIDDASRKAFVYFLKSKSDVLEAFQDFKSYVENQTGRRIKRIRTDNGKEYVNRAMQRYLRQAGIHHETTVPYNREQNGLAERMNRTLVERAKSMLFDARLEKRFWAEAVATASHVVNRSPTKGLPVTPEERFTGKRPDLSHLRVFGSEVMVHVPKEKRRKWDTKSEQGIFVGYSESSKAYRVYNCKAQDVAVSRDVIFLDEGQISRNEAVPSMEEAPFELVMQNEVEVAEVQDVNGEEDDLPAQEDELSPDESAEFEDAEEVVEDPQLAALPTQPEDPQQLVRRSVRERVTPGKYRDFHLGFSVFPHGTSQTPQFCDASGGAKGEPQTFHEAVTCEESDRWKDAMVEEYRALMKNQTWNLTDLPDGRKALRCKWVYKVKTNPDGSTERYKARLVIKGYSQVKGVDYEETYSPVVRYATIRYLMSLAASLDLQIHQMDAVTAFLQGELGEEDIYMQQPEGFVDPASPKRVCKLKKALYGLKQASRIWNQKLDGELRRLGLIRSKFDTCVYYRIANGQILIVAVYVDDLLMFSNSQRWVNELKKQLAAKFLMKDLGLANKVLGIRVTRQENKVCLDQEHYVQQLLERFGMEDCVPVATPLDHNQKLTKQMSPSTGEEREQMQNVPFRELVGGLQFLAQGTRPDISFAVNQVSQFCSDPGKPHWTAAKRILRYLKGTKTMKLIYSKQEDESFVGFSDADWGNDVETRRSITGYVFMKAGGPISWSCRRQSTVALSTTEAEYMAVSAAAQEAVWWRGLRQELSGVSEKITIFCDNKSAIHLAEREVGYSSRSKHIDIRHHFVREKIEEGIIGLVHVGSRQQVADLLTKAIPAPKFETDRQTIGVGRILG